MCVIQSSRGFIPKELGTKARATPVILANEEDISVVEQKNLDFRDPEWTFKSSILLQQEKFVSTRWPGGKEFEILAVCQGSGYNEQ